MLIWVGLLLYLHQNDTGTYVYIIIIYCGKFNKIMASITVTQFGMDWDMYLLNPEKQYIKVKMADLLPMAFTPQSLLLERDTPADS